MQRVEVDELRRAGIDVDNTDKALDLIKSSGLTATALSDSDIDNIESLKQRALAPISDAKPRKMKSAVRLDNKADDEVGYIDQDI